LVAQNNIVDVLLTQLRQGDRYSILQYIPPHENRRSDNFLLRLRLYALYVYMCRAAGIFKVYFYYFLQYYEYMKQPSCIPTSQRKFDARYEPASVKWLKHSISFLIITIDIRTIEGEEQCTASTAEEDFITVPQNKLRASGKLQYEIRKSADHLPNFAQYLVGPIRYTSSRGSAHIDHFPTSGDHSSFHGNIDASAQNTSATKLFYRPRRFERN